MSDALVPESLKREIERLKSLPQPQHLTGLAGLGMVPSDETRVVYTLMRQIFLERFQQFLEDALKIDSNWASRVSASREQFEEIQHGCSPLENRCPSNRD